MGSVTQHAVPSSKIPTDMKGDALQTLLFGTKRTRPLASSVPSKVQKIDNVTIPAPNKTEIKSERADDNDDVVQFFTSSAEMPKALAKKKKVKKPQTRKERINEEARRLRKEKGIHVWGGDVPAPLPSFASMKLPPAVLSNLDSLGLAQPRPIQMQVLPTMLKGREVLACAPTGSGKTLAFVLPVLAALGPTPADHPTLRPRAVVLAPTRELTTQIYNEFLRLESGLGTRVHLLGKMKKIHPSTKFDIIIATPKRLQSSLKAESGRLDLSSLLWLIMDESDKLFEEESTGGDSFRSQLADIHSAAASASAKLRRAFFSATYSDQVQDWAKVYLDNLITVCVGVRNTGAETISQEFIFTGTEQGKMTAMRSLIAKGLEPPVLIFVQCKDRAEQLSLELGSLLPPSRVGAVHGGRSESERDAAVRGFRSGGLWFLVCTEVLGRGMDFRGVAVVVNWDCPLSRVAYIHQIGRTGRAGRAGRALTLVTEADRPLLHGIASVATQATIKAQLPAFMHDIKKPAFHHMKRRLKKTLRAPKRDRISKNELFDKKTKKLAKPE